MFGNKLRYKLILVTASKIAGGEPTFTESPDIIDLDAKPALVTPTEIINISGVNYLPVALEHCSDTADKLYVQLIGDASTNYLQKLIFNTIKAQQNMRGPAMKKI